MPMLAPARCSRRWPTRPGAPSSVTSSPRARAPPPSWPPACPSAGRPWPSTSRSCARPGWWPTSAPAGRLGSPRPSVRSRRRRPGCRPRATPGTTAWRACSDGRAKGRGSPGENDPAVRRILKLGLAVTIVVLTPVTSAGVMLAAFLFLPLPAELPERVPPSPSQISRVYDAAGNEIGTFKQFETSIPVEPEDIPEHLNQAVIAAEDRNFYSHGGVDVRGTMRALLSDLRNREAAQGGSTITQQLVKNTVTGGDRSITRKIREAVL